MAVVAAGNRWYCIQAATRNTLVADNLLLHHTSAPYNAQQSFRPYFSGHLLLLHKLQASPILPSHSLRSHTLHMRICEPSLACTNTGKSRTYMLWMCRVDKCGASLLQESQCLSVAQYGAAARLYGAAMDNKSVRHYPQRIVSRA